MTTSANHPHEPDIAPSIADDGHCRVCRLLVRNAALLAALESVMTLNDDAMPSQRLAAEMQARAAIAGAK